MIGHFFQISTSRFGFTSSFIWKSRQDLQTFVPFLLWRMALPSQSDLHKDWSTWDGYTTPASAHTLRAICKLPHVSPYAMKQCDKLFCSVGKRYKISSNDQIIVGSKIKGRCTVIPEIFIHLALSGSHLDIHPIPLYPTVCVSSVGQTTLASILWWWYGLSLWSHHWFHLSLASLCQPHKLPCTG